jgi:ketosteroid isomerase-like protein
MTTTELDTLRDQVRWLVDRAEIDDLVDRFSRDLDDFTRDRRSFDVAWVRRYFTDDATVAYPVGSASGAAAIAALIDGTGMAPFQRTQHVTANHLVELDGDRAAVRFNLIATHVLAKDGTHFTVGDYYEGTVLRTAEGWRFTDQSLTVTWTDGSPPG